jgi:hypothetical protein
MRKTLALLLALAAILPTIADAQGRNRPDPQFAKPDQIDPAEGVRVIEAFRNARTKGDYSFSFELVNRPKGGDQSEVFGSMWGTWDEDGKALTRVDIALPERHTLHLIYHGGADGKILRSLDDGQTEEIKGEARFAPIIDGLTFTTFDLQMPFVYWTNYTYEGTKKLIGRPAHYFLFTPPADYESKDVKSVRVAIDAGFMVMLYAEELDQSGKTTKSFRINDFAKTDGQWIVKEIDLVDANSKDRTRFKVLDARVGLNLPAEIFAPDENGMIKTVKTDENTQVGN